MHTSDELRDVKQKEMASVKILWRIPKQLIRLLISEESILFPLIYNTRFVLNNTEVTHISDELRDVKQNENGQCKKIWPIPKKMIRLLISEECILIYFQ